MTNTLIHVLIYRDRAAAETVEGSNAVSATSENVERSEAVALPETVDRLESRSAILSVVRTNCFACAVLDDEKEEEEEIQQSNLANPNVVSDVQSGEKEKKEEKQKQKAVLVLGETLKEPSHWLNTRPNPRLSNPPNHLHGELVAAGWPSWLSAVAGGAINGWVPRRADTFEKLNKIGKGRRSSIYKARDTLTGKIVALKKVRFNNLEPESIKFMAREILILRRLDHPNVIKLKALVTSKMYHSLCLVFEYMEHDLAGLAANPQIKFTEPQVKCYMQQLLLGLEYCHNCGVLHRDINGSNLLIDNGGTLKIAGFGSASFFDSTCKLPMSSRVVTLWYRPPELLMGATDYGVGVDLWSMGCVLAELLAGRPIMPGRKEMEQLHKIFKLCGSPSEEFRKKSKLPHATICKPLYPYRRCIQETFKDFLPTSLPLIETLLAIDPVERQTATAALRSEFFTTEPYACEPSSLPKYPSKKHMDAKQRDEKSRRNRANNAMNKGERFPALHQDGSLGPCIDGNNNNNNNR